VTPAVEFRKLTCQSGVVDCPSASKA
jgi:hypothetical protein